MHIDWRNVNGRPSLLCHRSQRAKCRWSRSGQWLPEFSGGFFRAAFDLPPIAKVAVARALHDCLGPRQLQAPVIALAKGTVALAREEVTNFAKSHRCVHLGVTAAHDIVGEFSRC